MMKQTFSMTAKIQEQDAVSDDATCRIWRRERGWGLKCILKHI